MHLYSRNRNKALLACSFCSESGHRMAWFKTCWVWMQLESLLNMQQTAFKLHFSHIL